MAKARSTERRSSCTSSTCASLSSVNSASRSASRIPCSASSHEPPGLGERGAGGGERVPGTRRGVSFLVLHGVQQMREPPEEPAGLGERFGVAAAGPARTAVCAKAAAVAVSVGSVTVSSGVPGPASASMPVCRSTASTSTAVSKPSSRAGTRPGPVPARGDPAGGRGDRAARSTARPGRRRGPVPSPRRAPARRRRPAWPPRPGDRSGPHGAQRTGPRGAPPSGGALGLSLRQNRDDQAVVVRDDPGELPVVRAKCEAQPAEMGHPLGLEALRRADGCRA